MNSDDSINAQYPVEASGAETTPSMANGGRPVPGAGTAEHVTIEGTRQAVRMHFRAQSYDIDFAQHMNNIGYLRWCEDLRLALLDQVMPLDEGLKQGLCPVVAETYIRYRRPVALFDIVVGTQYISDIEERFFHTTTDMHRGEELVAKCVQKLCIMDVATGRAVPVPQGVRDLHGLSGE
jgi:acyl-CoA thioesterase FadM